MVIRNNFLHKIQVVLIVFFVAGLLFVGYVNFDTFSIKNFFFEDVPIVKINGISFKVEVSSTLESRIQGLSGRRDFGEYDGMLFVFPESGYPEIWMKDMLFPIALIWIDENLKIISIENHISPETFPKKFRPPTPVKYVIEMNVDIPAVYSLGVGDSVTLPYKVK